MPLPILLAIDHDAKDLQAVCDLLAERFAETVEVAGARNVAEACERLDSFAEQGRHLALAVSEERLEDGSGLDLMHEISRRFPSAKRALLTAYGSVESAMRAINENALDAYLLKPWQPNEEALLASLQDLLDDWFAVYERPYEGVQLYGHRWSPDSHRLKDFLARNQVPYRWIDVEASADDPEVVKMLASIRESLPAVVLPGGECLENPSTAAFADKAGLGSIGLKTRPDFRGHYDLAIVGGGPAGLAAAVYGASEGLRTVMIEREAVGGQAGSSSLIENYLGFPRGLSGAELARRARDQAMRFKVEILSPQEAVHLSGKGQFKSVHLADGQRLSAHAVLLAMGVEYCRLDIPGEDRLFGKGVYYGAALSEAMSCADEHVVIIGGANSAGQAAMYFSGYAGRVTMLVRGKSLSSNMSSYLNERIQGTTSIEVRTDTEAREFLGEDRIEGVRIAGPDGESTLNCDGVFIFIGARPHTDWLGDQVVRDPCGFILTGNQLVGRGKRVWPEKRPPFLLETSWPGVFAAGDVRSESIKRVASSVGQGSIAVQLIHEYLRALQV